jgi:hypothetical protein
MAACVARLTKALPPTTQRAASTARRCEDHAGARRSCAYAREHKSRWGALRPLTHTPHHPQTLRDPALRARYDRVLTQRELRLAVAVQDEIGLGEMEREADPGSESWQQGPGWGPGEAHPDGRLAPSLAALGGAWRSPPAWGHWQPLRAPGPRRPSCYAYAQPRCYSPRAGPPAARPAAGEAVFTYVCRCGDVYALHEGECDPRDLSTMVVPCCTCSNHILVNLLPAGGEADGSGSSGRDDRGGADGGGGGDRGHGNGAVAAGEAVAAGTAGVG